MHKLSRTTYKPPLDTGLNIRYEDEHVIIVNKPAGLLSVPGKGENKSDCMSKRVERDFPNATVMHRLDMNTSGLMLFALTRRARQNIQRQFERRNIKKTYHAYVFGKPSSPEGIIDAPMRCDWPNRPKQMIDNIEGKKAITHYQLLKPGPFSLVELNPKTGRSHQLRLHMLHIGHPILGDFLYGNDACKKNNVLHLHATSIAFRKPNSDEIVTISQLPQWYPPC